jgi:hypothetical protein
MGAGVGSLPHPSVLTGWRATVGPGGRAGTVRVRVRTRTGDQVVGDPVQLPAEPGTYTFPAPRVEGTAIGLDQATGGHAIMQMSSEAIRRRMSRSRERR